MDNPFLKRVTERLEDEEAFLEIVSPEPLTTFLAEHGHSGALYEVLAVIAGTPGSGKTTLARLFQLPTIVTLLRNRSFSSYKALLASLVECGAIRNEEPLVLAVRLPMESTYRDIWEFPYPEELRISLLTALIQARAVLGWLRNLESVGVEEADIEFITKDDAGAAVASIGGTAGFDVGQRARQVESALYAVAGALIAPPLAELPTAATGAYRPFDVIAGVRAKIELQGVMRRLELLPLIILDDAHALHPAQFIGVKRWLARRELRIARWMLTRLDILTPHEVLQPVTGGSESELPGLMASRDVLPITLQSSISDRREHRTAFRQMARDMAGRYLRRMAVFERKGLRRLEDLLATEEPTISLAKLDELARSVDSTQTRLGINSTRRKTLEDEVARYADSVKGARVTPDLHLAMVSILMNRYANRVPQETLFASEGSPEPSKPVAAKKSVYEAARLHLLHKFKRPFYYGMETLADASSENAEQFLQLAYQLVDSAETQLTRGRSATLDAATQDRDLRHQAEKLLTEWSFPYYKEVRRLTDKIALRCRATSLKPNAHLGSGANAYGIRTADFARITTEFPHLARVLQFGIAYNAFTLVPDYDCKNETWYLLELGGLVNVARGLTLQRGGFLEGSADELARLLAAEEA